MAGKSTAPVLQVVTTSLAGKTGQEIAAMIASGEITQEYAEEFVAERAIRKLHKAQGE